MALVLMLSLGTVTPTWAASNGVSLASTGVVLPFGEELSDQELGEVRGQFVHWVGGALVGAAGFLISAHDQEIDADWWLRFGTSVAVGAATGGIMSAASAPALALASTEIAVLNTTVGVAGAITTGALGQDPYE